MAYQTRCPECEAKLKLEDTPAADEQIECPKCGHQFTTGQASKAAAKAAAVGAGKGSANDDPSAKKDKPNKGAKSDKKAGKKSGKRKVKQKKTNPAVLVMMGLIALIFMAAVGYFVFKFVFATGKIDKMLSYIPADYNFARGMAVRTITKYPGYVGELTKVYTGQPKTIADALAEAAGADAESFVDYLVIGKKMEANSQVYVIRTQKGFDAKFGGKLTEANIGGQAAFRGTAGALRGTIVYVPYDKTIVVVAGANVDAVAQTTLAGNKGTEGTFVSTLGATGNKTVGGHLWTLVKATGPLSKYISVEGERIKKDFPAVGEQMLKSKQLGVWVTFGTLGVKLGAGIECDSKESAAAAKKSMREGPLSKQDDSEVPNESKQVIPNSGVKEFKTEFLSNISYNSTGDCAYFETRVGIAKGAQLINPFNNPNMAGN